MIPVPVISALTSKWALLGVAVTLIVIQYGLLQRANEKVGKLRALQEAQVAQTEEAVAANQSCVGTVDELEATLAELVAARRADQALADALIADRDERLSRAARRASEERRARRELWNKSQSCAGLASLRMDVACSPVAERLRQRSSGQGGHGNPDG